MDRSDSDLLLSEEQAILQKTLRDFVAERVTPAAEALDHDAVHPDALVAGMAELGLFGILVPTDAGGVGMGHLAHGLAVEELACGAGGLGAILAAHGLAADALVGSGIASPLIADAASGAALLAPALQEDDAQLVTTEAASVDGGWVLTGRKVQVAFPGRAAAFVVLAREDKSYALFLALAGAAGLRHDGPDERLSLNCLETGTVVLDRTPATRLGGADLVSRVLASARIAVSCLLAGIGRGAVAAAMKYAHERKQFDRFLHEFVAMQERMSRGDARVEAARALAHGAARLRDRGEPCGLAAARARLVAGEAAMSAADDALQVFGGYGFSREYPAERFYRDARFGGFGESHPPALYLNITKGIAP